WDAANSVARNARGSTGASRAFIAFPRVYSVFASGSYTPSAEHQSDSESAHSTGLKTRLRVVRGSGDPAVEHRIGPSDYPVNILGGHRWPSAPKLGNICETVLCKEVGPLTDLTPYDSPEAADNPILCRDLRLWAAEYAFQ